MTEQERRIQAAEAADSADPGDLAAVARLLDAAELCLRRHEVERAAPLARRATLLAPQHGQAHRVLSGILATCGKRDDAIVAALQAVRLQPAQAEWRLHLGALLAAAGRLRLAAEHLAAYVATPKPDVSGWRQLSWVLQELGRPARALEAIDKAIAAAPDTVEFAIHRASLLAAAARYDEALAELRRAEALDANDARIWRSASSLHEVLEDLPRALSDAERAVYLDPAQPEFAQHLAHVRALLGMTAAASAAAVRETDYWTQRPPRVARPAAPAPTLHALLAIQSRIVLALMLREMRTRFSRSRLGYVWAVLEPISHIATLGSVFALLNHSPPPIGNNLFLFYLTGLLPFLMFGHVANEIMSALHANGAVLQIPMIKRIDIIASRALLQLATEITVGITVFGCSALLGWQGMPADLLTVMQAVLFLWLLAVGVGTLNIVLSALMPSWETFFAAVMRLMYFASGIYYTPIAMPGPIRAILVWNPVLQCIEWFRSGFYAGYDPHWLDRGYVLVWVLAALLIGLAAERAMRRQITVLA